MSVFLYHHAAAMPPRTTEAAATSPIPTHPEGRAAAVSCVDEVVDSKEVDMSDNTF